MGNREGDAFDVYPMTSCTMPTGTSALPGSSSVPLLLYCNGHFYSIRNPTGYASMLGFA